MLKLKPKTQKLFAVTGLFTVSIILVVVILVSLNVGNNKVVITKEIQKDNDKVVAGKITDNTGKTATSIVKEDKNNENTEAVTPTDKTNVVIPLTEIKDTKPTPPPVPKVKHDITEKGDKNVVPTKKANPQAPSKPSGGDTSHKGQTYVPGFGWVDNSGSNQGGDSDSSGDINKQVGKMD